MSQAKTVDTTTGALSRAVSSRRSLFGGVAAVVLGGGITAGVAASVADLVPTNLDLPPLGGRYALPAAYPTEMHAILRVKGAVPPEDFQLWLSIGLRMADAAEKRA